MYIIGTLHESNCVTCVRYGLIQWKNGSQQYLIVASLPQKLIFYTLDFKFLTSIQFTEVIVQFEFVNFLNNPYKELVLFTYSQKLQVCRVALKQSTMMDKFKQNSVDVSIDLLKQFDLSDEIRRNADGDVKIVNYFQYLVIDTKTYWILCLIDKTIKISKQQPSILIPLPEIIVYQYINRPQMISQDSGSIQVQNQENNLFDFVFLSHNDIQHIMEISLIGLCSYDLTKHMIIKNISLGFFVQSINLMSKEQPIYLLESSQEGVLRMLDIMKEEIINKIDIKMEVIGVFPFEQQLGALISVNIKEEPFIVRLDSIIDPQFEAVSIKINITSAVALNSQNFFITSSTQNSYFIKDQIIVDYLSNIGPIIHINEMKVNQKQLLLTSSTNQKQTHIFKKGIKIIQYHATFRLPSQKQIPDKIFILSPQYILLSFLEQTIVMMVDNKTFIPINQGYNNKQPTIMVEQFSGNEFIQVTNRSINFLNLSNHQSIKIDSYNQQDIQVDLNIVLYQCILINSVFTIFDEEYNIHTYQLMSQNSSIIKIKTSQDKLQGQVKCSTSHKQSEQIALSLWWKYGQIIMLDKQLNQKIIPLNNNYSISDILFCEDQLLIGYSYGSIEILHFNLQDYSLRTASVIKVSQPSFMRLYSYNNQQIICLTTQLYMINPNKLKSLKINWDDIQDLSIKDNLILGRDKQGLLSLISLDQEESQYCQSIFFEQEIEFFDFFEDFYIIITKSKIIVYDQNCFEIKTEINHGIKVYNLHVYQKNLYICGSNVEQNPSMKQGVFMLIQFDEQNKLQVMWSQRQKQIIQDLKVKKDYFWILLQTQVKCFKFYNSGNSKPLIKHDFKIPLSGFDIHDDLILVYDEFKSTCLYKIIYEENKIIAGGQYYQCVCRSNIFGDLNSILSFEKTGRISIAQLNFQTLGICDNMPIQKWIHKEPIYSVKLNESRSQLTFGSIFGNVGFIRYIEHPDELLFQQVQRILKQKLNIIDFDIKSSIELDFINYDIIKAGKSYFGDLLSKDQENELSKFLEILERVML